MFKCNTFQRQIDGTYRDVKWGSFDLLFPAANEMRGLYGSFVAYIYVIYFRVQYVSETHR